MGLNGVINVYKEPDFTSFDVVAKLRGMLKIKKIGHTGTLDPDAVGVLPICLNNATKVCELLMDDTKEYVALLRLGIDTDTQDTSGRIINKYPNDIRDILSDNDKLNDILNTFTGEIEQIPPMYSAIKVNGQRLYDLARKGIEVERKPRKVTIHSIEIVDNEQFDFHLIRPDGDIDEVLDDVNAVRIAIKVTCSKGTYIRSLCHDIGEKLGVYGCMEALIRTRVGLFSLDNAYTLDELQQIVDKTKINGTRDEALFLDTLDNISIKVDELFESLDKLHVLDEGIKALKNGNQLKTEVIKECLANDIKMKARNEYRVYDNQNIFCGIYEYHSGYKILKPVKLFL